MFDRISSETTWACMCPLWGVLNYTLNFISGVYRGGVGGTEAGEEGKGSSYFMSAELLCAARKKFRRWIMVMVTQHGECV